jgi:cytochrome c-type biogenesis protein CcmH/NrfG
VNAILHCDLGEVHLRQRRPAAATLQFGEALRIDPLCRAASDGLAKARAMTARPDPAESAK